MLINFSVTNFLSIDEKQTFSMEAGKARKYSERIYKHKNLKLTKCKAIFGANASGKSNLVDAFAFMQEMVEDGLPLRYYDKFFRLNESNTERLTEFEVEICVNETRYIYGFSIMLNTGKVHHEYLYNVLSNGRKKILFDRNLALEEFWVGDYFNDKNVVIRVETYGEDSLAETGVLFLSLINSNKTKMFNEFAELAPFKDVYSWIVDNLYISKSYSSMTGTPYYSDADLGEVAELLNALGIGISDSRYIKLSLDIARKKMPEDIFLKVISDLERENVRAKEKEPYIRPAGVLRAMKEFYRFAIDENDEITIETLEFSHEKEGVYFELMEESDGTVRLLDLVEIFLESADRNVYIIDEFDRYLHPMITEKLIDLFLHMAAVRNTQLIFTSHESRLFAEDILRNDEICFTMKNSEGASIINPLEKYQLRADKRIYAALFDGTIDEVPSIDANKLNELFTF